MYIISLLSGLLIGSITAKRALLRGRSYKLWFAIGFFFGLIGFISLYLFPPITHKEEPQEEVVTDLRNWYYLDEQGKTQGPVSTDRLKKLSLSNERLVWEQELPDWTSIGGLRTTKKL